MILFSNVKQAYQRLALISYERIVEIIQRQNLKAMVGITQLLYTPFFGCPIYPMQNI